MCEGGEGGGGGGATETKDVFEALMTGDMAAVIEYVDAGGDCSIKDSIGEGGGWGVVPESVYTFFAFRWV